MKNIISQLLQNCNEIKKNDEKNRRFFDGFTRFEVLLPDLFLLQGEKAASLR